MKCFSVSNTSAPKLQNILTGKQDGKWCWDGDLNRTVDKIFQDMVAFSSFNHLELSEYPELKELWYGQVGQKIFSNLKHLVVHKCTFLSNVIFSSNLLQMLYTLEELEVAKCDSLEAVLDPNVLDDKAMESKTVSRLRKLTLSGLPNLKHIWNKEAGDIISFGNLQIVKVDKCQHLKYLFPVSPCQDLKQLEVLHIESCGVEEIFSIEGLEELIKFDFPRLRILWLYDLTRLINFCPKRYTLQCPSLKILHVSGGEELRVFAFDHLNSQPLREDDIDELQIEQALFYIEKVSQNLEDLSLNEKDTMRIFNGNYEKNLFQSIRMLRLQHFQETPIKFLNDLIQKFPAITALEARCSYFKTLFPLEEIGHCSMESPTQIKTLHLFQLEQLEDIWNDDDSASHPLVQNLEHLSIMECSGMIRLAPPSASFKNLTFLGVKDCNGLMYFMTSCTAKSLMHLTNLIVSNCRKLEEVVITDEGEPKEEITFESLKYLELTGLSAFKRFCSGKHTFVFPSLVTLKVIGCHKMQNFSYGVIIAPFLILVEVKNGKKRWKEDLNTTIRQLFIEQAIEEGVEGDYKESSSINMQSSQMHQKSVTTSRAISSGEHGAESKADEIADSGKQEMHKLPIPHTGIDSQKICEIVEMPLDQASQNTLSLTKVDGAIEIREMHETTEGDFIQDAQNTLSFTIVQDAAIGTEEMNETIQTPFTEAIESKLIHTSIQETSTASIMKDDEENKYGCLDIGTKEMHETIQRPLLQNADEDMLIPASVQDIEESHNSDIHLSKNLFNQTITSLAEDYKETIGTQEIYESKRRFSVHDAQNILSPTMVQDTAIDPSPSQASKTTSSSTPIAEVCSSLKEMDRLLPYLEAGVKRHPQVLDWLNTKRRRVYASSAFSLFADVTRILRTTRKGHLTEDDRNYIRECCTVLQGVGFNASWLSYVNKSIEECGNGEDIKRKVEETKGKASGLEAHIESMKKELASVKESLVLLLDKASGLDDFIES